MTQVTARSNALDLFKAMLVVGMVLAHALQLLADNVHPMMLNVGRVINLISFSGFLFAFGIGTGLSKQNASTIPWKKRLRSPITLLLATYASSVGFQLLVYGGESGPTNWVDLFLLRQLFGYSEFLASFFLIGVILAFFRSQVIALATHPVGFGVAFIVSVASCFVVVPPSVPLSGILFSSDTYACFPVLPYLPWLLIGVVMGRGGFKPVPLWWFIPALFGTAAFGVYTVLTGDFPNRFPPHPFWIYGGALALAVYMVVAQRAAAFNVPEWLALPGRHALSHLIFSNLALFVTYNVWGRPHTADWMPLAYTVTIVVMISCVREAIVLAGKRQMLPANK